MIIRVLVIFAMFFTLLCASELELQIGQNSNNLSDETLKKFKKYFVPPILMIDNKEAQKRVSTNSLFAKEYLSKYDIDREIIVLLVEDFLSKEYMKEVLKDAQIDDKVLKSYYNTNIEHFKKDISYDLMVYTFSSKKDALESEKNLKSGEGNNSAIFIYNYQDIERAEIPTIYHIYLDATKEGEYSSVIFNDDKYHIIKYTKVYPPRDIEFENAKDMIKKDLLNKRFFDILNSEKDRLENRAY